MEFKHYAAAPRQIAKAGWLPGGGTTPVSGDLREGERAARALHYEEPSRPGREGLLSRPGITA